MTGSCRVADTCLPTPWPRRFLRTDTVWVRRCPRSHLSICCMSGTPGRHDASLCRAIPRAPHILARSAHAEAKLFAEVPVGDLGCDVLDGGAPRNPHFIEPVATATVGPASVRPVGPALDWRFEKLAPNGQPAPHRFEIPIFSPISDQRSAFGQACTAPPFPGCAVT